MKPNPARYYNCVRICHLSLVFFLCFWLIACAASPDRRHPEFSDRMQPIKILCLLPADIIVYEELPDGRLVHRRDWSLAVHNDLKQTLVDELSARDYRVLTYPESELARSDELYEILSLYRAVNKSIQLHTFGPDIFPAKKTRFKYSVGSLQKLREQKEADGYIFARVLHRVTDQQTRSYVSLGLADDTGSILWYGANGVKDSAGGKSFDSTLILVRSILTDFPEVRF